MVNLEYEATLKIDEMSYLRTELPQMNVPMLDPDYNLCKINIKIPRAELVKEAIHILNSKLEALEESRKSKVEDLSRESQVPTITPSANHGRRFW